MATQQTRSLARFMLAPSVVLLFIWMAVPLALTLWFSFQQYNPLNPIRDGFIGFSNYALFYNNPAFLAAILNTLIIVVSVLLITIVGGTPETSSAKSGETSGSLRRAGSGPR